MTASVRGKAASWSNSARIAGARSKRRGDGEEGEAGKGGCRRAGSGRVETGGLAFGLLGLLIGARLVECFLGLARLAGA